MKQGKSRERGILKGFKKVYPDFPHGEIQDFESPDFLVMAGTEIIGIEITEYIRGASKKGSPKRQWEINAKETVDLALRVFEKDHPGIFLWVSIFWATDLIDKKLISDIGQSIARLVAKHCPKGSIDEVEIEWEGLDDPLLEDVLDSVSIRRNDEAQENSWTSPCADFIGPSYSELQRIIDEKETKVSNYRKNCDVIWLLIYAHGDFLSSMAATNFPEEFRFVSSFDEIFFYDERLKRVYYLKKD